jgi:hypothetical protein
MLTRVFLAAALLSASASLCAVAQSTPAATSATDYSLKDGAYRLNGQTMRLEAGRSSSLTKALTLSDGSVINTNGTLVRKDGTRQVLANGQAVNMQGVVVNLRDDMLTDQSIVKHNQAVTGSTGETRFSLPGTSGPAAHPAQVQQLLLLEKRFALLQQMTDKVDSRATQALGKTSKASIYDKELRAINEQLRP